MCGHYHHHRLFRLFPAAAAAVASTSRLAGWFCWYCGTEIVEVMVAPVAVVLTTVVSDLKNSVARAVELWPGWITLGCRCLREGDITSGFQASRFCQV